MSQPDEREGDEVAELLVNSAVRYIVMDGIVQGISFTEVEQKSIAEFVKGTIAYLTSTSRKIGVEEETGRLLAILALGGEDS